MADSIALKNYLEDQKILPDSVWKNELSVQKTRHVKPLKAYEAA